PGRMQVFDRRPFDRRMSGRRLFDRWAFDTLARPGKCSRSQRANAHIRNHEMIVDLCYTKEKSRPGDGRLLQKRGAGEAFGARETARPNAVESSPAMAG